MYNLQNRSVTENEAVNEFNTIYFVTSVEKEQMCVHQLGEQATINHVWAAVCPLIISKWLEKNPANRIIRVSKHATHTHTPHMSYLLNTLSTEMFQSCWRVTLSVEWIIYIRQSDGNRALLKKTIQTTLFNGS